MDAFLVNNSVCTGPAICPGFSWYVLFFLLEMVSRWNLSILEIVCFFENSRCLAAQLEKQQRHTGYIWAGQSIWFYVHMQTICTSQVQQTQCFVDVFLLRNPAEKEGKPTNYSDWNHTSIFTKLENFRIKDSVPSNALDYCHTMELYTKLSWNCHLLLCCLCSPVELLTKRWRE